jgi:pseudoazurin
MHMPKLIAPVTLALAVLATPVLAANVDVEMLNRGPNGTMVFSPDLIRIDVGDTVTFQPTDKGHDVQSIAGLIPTGATPFKGKMSQPLVETFTVPGVYAVKCQPHYGLGMVAVVVVGGDLSNLPALKAAHNPARAQDRFNAILAELGQ